MKRRHVVAIALALVMATSLGSTVGRPGHSGHRLDALPAGAHSG